MSDSTLNCSVIFDLIIRLRLLLNVSSGSLSPNKSPGGLLRLLLLYCLKLSIDGNPNVYSSTVFFHALADDLVSVLCVAESSTSAKS